jgi:hypothetical protein
MGRQQEDEIRGDNLSPLNGMDLFEKGKQFWQLVFRFEYRWAWSTLRKK